MFHLKSYYIFQLLSIIPVFTYSKVTIDDILSFESISCGTDDDCPNSYTCKNSYCQYPTFYCIGNDTCIEENKSNNALYSIQDNSHPEENELNHIHSESSLIIESCHPNNYNCYTRPCFKDSDCFSNNCEMESNRCIINKEYPLYTCINKEEGGGMICSKSLEEKCNSDDECLSQHCDTQLSICSNIRKDDPYTKNMTKDDDIRDELQNNENVQENKEDIDKATIIKESLILVFVILPVVVLTQYVKTTKFVKNIKRNRKPFEYKSVLVEDLNKC